MSERSKAAAPGGQKSREERKGGDDGDGAPAGEAKVIDAVAPVFVPASSRKQLAFVMVDGEFGGPHWTRHPVLAWSLVVFVKGAPLCHVHQTSSAWLSSLVKGHVTVRMKARAGSAMDRATVTAFWDKHPLLYRWVTQETVTWDAGMATIHKFLVHWSDRFSLRFVSKPASIDLGRLQHGLALSGSPFILHHTSVCLTTQLFMARVLASSDLMSLLNYARERCGQAPTPSHNPLEDCLGQIVEFLMVDMVLRTHATPPPLFRQQRPFLHTDPYFKR